jgi:hypothetical protein
MNRTTIILFTVFLIVGQASISSARIGYIAKMLIPCGGGGQICAVDDPGFTSSGGTSGGGTSSDLAYSGSSTCESSSWGNEQQGGTQTACSSGNGSSSWYESEWSDGNLVEDWGSTTVNEDGSVTTQSGSSDTSSSTAPAKFRNSGPAR